MKEEKERKIAAKMVAYGIMTAAIIIAHNIAIYLYYNIVINP